MAKKTKAKQAASAASGVARSQLPKRLEQLDRQLFELLNQRAEVHRQVVQSKREEGTDLSQVMAEQLVWLEQTMRKSDSLLGKRALQAIFRELVSGCQALVQPLKVAYLGPLYSYSHLATIQRFGQDVELAPVATIRAVFEEVNRRQSDFGIVPIENSTDGRVIDTLDMFARLPVQICGEVPLPIHHNLLGKCRREQVQEVYSKPQALSQCRQWLAQHLPTARTVEMTSTTAAAQLAAEKPGAAAIASLQAATNYGLEVIAADIEDNPHNVTRFAVIGHQAPPRTGRDKTSLMFAIPHRPGALADAMAIFKRNRLNLTWIESFPMAGTPNEYLFFAELEGHRNEVKVKRALAALEPKTIRLEVLGSYPVGAEK